MVWPALLGLSAVALGGWGGCMHRSLLCCRQQQMCLPTRRYLASRLGRPRQGPQGSGPPEDVSSKEEALGAGGVGEGGEDVPSGLREAAEAAGQGHVFEAWPTLGPEERRRLLQSVQGVDFGRVGAIFAASQEPPREAGPIEPLRDADVVQMGDIHPEEEIRWMHLGSKLVAEGKVGVILLAGGQGTRLGSSAPKGAYNIGLPSGKPLFQLQAERIRRLQVLAAAALYGKGAEVRKPVRWYVMTSPAMSADTQAFFAKRGYFGLERSQVFFFEQGMLPCFSREGKVLLDTPASLATAPDGNGGVYEALERSGALADMAAHGVACCDCCSVDNALVRPADPLFIGFCAEAGAPCGARTIAKASPGERVGVFARRGGRVGVVEYSEMDPAEAAATVAEAGEAGAKPRWSLLKRLSGSGDKPAPLRYPWSNVCMHFFTLAFLREAAAQLPAHRAYHTAHKAIPTKDGPVQGGCFPELLRELSCLTLTAQAFLPVSRLGKGIKLEQFIFDALALAPRVALLEVARGEEFAPVKNAPGEGVADSPATARALILALHQRWVEAAGGRVRLPPEGPQGLEVSPLVSYSGEGLSACCRGRTIRSPNDEFLQGRVSASLLGKKLKLAQLKEVRTPGGTPVGTPGTTPGGTPRETSPGRGGVGRTLSQILK